MSEIARDKRITKPPEKYVIPKICYPRKRKKQLKKKPLEECKFQIIPCPIKFIYACTTYIFYGDVTLREHEGNLVCDTSLLNHGRSCKSVNIIDKGAYKMIQLALDVNFSIKLPPWQHIVYKLKESGNLKMIDWANAIEKYSFEYENMLRALSDRESNLDDQEKQQLAVGDQKAKRKLQELFKKYPCVNFKYEFRNGGMHITEICANDDYIKELGYSTDSFSLTVLREGLPHLLPAENTITTRAFIENFSHLGSDEHKTDDVASMIITKNGHSRKVQYRLCSFPTFENGKLGFNTCIVVTGKEYPFSINTEERRSYCSLNKQFLEQMLAKEQESQSFLKRFYNSETEEKYSSMHRVCKIRELEPFGRSQQGII